MILAMVDDLLFLSKIQETAKHLGIDVKAAQPAHLPELAVEASPSALIIDLNHRSGKSLEVLRALKAEAKTQKIPAVGFVSHVQNELITAARDAGCNLVLARSAFAGQLPSILQRFSLPELPGPGGT
jgi:DNA-binding NarL/FixJ family response regulator